MAITMRKGKHIDFDPSKLKTAEWAVVIENDPESKDGKAVYMCFAAGNVKRMSTYEDMKDNMENLADDMLDFLTADVQKVIQQATQMVNEGNIVITNSREAIKNAELATSNANDAAAEIRLKAENGDFSSKISSVSAVTGEAGTQASVQNTGTEQEANFVFTIPKGDTGEPFQIKKTYSSIDEMNLGFYTDEDVLEGQFVVIDTGNVNDEDNAKLFMKGKFSYAYITDLSGADGLTGPIGPQGQAAGFGVPIATVDSNVGTPSVVVSASGPDTEKVFSFAFHNLKGEPGAKGEIDENSAIQFQKAEIRDNIHSGETLVMIMGKIEKTFSDLKPVAFTARYEDLEGAPGASPSPHNLIFTGASNVIYNGSEEKIVNIPESLPANGGNADTIEHKNLSYIMDYENLENAPYDFVGTLAGLNEAIESGRYYERMKVYITDDEEDGAGGGSSGSTSGMQTQIEAIKEKMVLNTTDKDGFVKKANKPNGSMSQGYPLECLFTWSQRPAKNAEPVWMPDWRLHTSSLLDYVEVASGNIGDIGRGDPFIYRLEFVWFNSDFAVLPFDKILMAIDIYKDVQYYGNYGKEAGWTYSQTIEGTKRVEEFKMYFDADNEVAITCKIAYRFVCREGTFGIKFEDVKLTKNSKITRGVLKANLFGYGTNEYY